MQANLVNDVQIPNVVYDMIPDMARYVFPHYFSTGKYIQVEYQKSGDLFFMHFDDEEGSRIWTIKFTKQKLVIADMESGR
jgi:hypothetical protein